MGFGDVSRDTVVQAVIRLKEDQPPGETCGDFLDRLTAMIGVDMQPHRKSPGARKAYSMLYHMADLAYYTPEFRDGGLTESDIELAKRSQSMQQFVQGLSNEEHVWMDIPCSIEAQVDVEGKVSLVHATAYAASTAPSQLTPASLQPNSRSSFRVRWAGGSFPTAASNCSSAAGCRVDGETCICATHVSTAAVFVDALAPPGKAAILAQLHVGSLAPEDWPAGTFERCVSGLGKSEFHLLDVGRFEPTMQIKEWKEERSTVEVTFTGDFAGKSREELAPRGSRLASRTSSSCISSSSSSRSSSSSSSSSATLRLRLRLRLPRQHR